MDRRGDHESVIGGGCYGNRRQRVSQSLAADRRKRQWQTSVQSLPSADAERDNGPTYDLVGFWPTCESLLVNSSNRFLFAAGIT